MRSGIAGMTTIMNAILFDFRTIFTINTNKSHKKPRGIYGGMDRYLSFISSESIQSIKKVSEAKSIQKINFI